MSCTHLALSPMQDIPLPCFGSPSSCSTCLKPKTPSAQWKTWTFPGRCLILPFLLSCFLFLLWEERGLFFFFSKQLLSILPLHSLWVVFPLPVSKVLISGLHLRACSKSTAQESTQSCQDKGLPLILGFSTSCLRHEAGYHFWTSLLWTCKTCTATVKAKLKLYSGKTQRAPLGRMESANWWGFVFFLLWASAGFVQLKWCSYHWERMWAGSIPSVLSSLFLGRDVALTQQNLKTFPGK